MWGERYDADECRGFIDQVQPNKHMQTRPWLAGHARPSRRAHGGLELPALSIEVVRPQSANASTRLWRATARPSVRPARRREVEPEDWPRIPRKVLGTPSVPRARRVTIADGVRLSASGSRNSSTARSRATPGPSGAA